MVFNSGTVVGTKDVVHLYGSGAFLHNSGFIGSDIGYAVKLTTTANATTKIVNSGHIGSGVAAISGGPGVDWVENNGMLQGAISLGGNDDIYDGRGGGSISQRLDLGDGNDTAYGSAGNEALGGDNDNDWLDGGFGDDDLQGGDGIDTAAFSGSVGATVSLALVQQNTNYGLDALTEIENLSGGSGADRFTGDLKANTLMGNAGNDSLDGGDGDDILDGGSGTDTVVFSGSLAAIANLALGSATGYGTDTLINIENLTGGAGADRFTGNSSANMLIGDAGNDTLLGGLGNDKLTGGSGADFFVFDTSLSAKKNVDTITDFRRVDDSFQLENAIFKKLAKVGALSKSSFVVGAKAKDKNDYIVYDKAKGVLYYDADGSGSGAAVKFAQLKKGLVIDHKDFFII
jgi:Ca2+-binding RTX toxin-like protein